MHPRAVNWYWGCERPVDSGTRDEEMQADIRGRVVFRSVVSIIATCASALTCAGVAFFLITLACVDLSHRKRRRGNRGTGMVSRSVRIVTAVAATLRPCRFEWGRKRDETGTW